MVTVAEAEREIMRRTGPFEEHTVSSVTASTATLVYADAVKTSLNLGGYQHMWLLRRGLNSSGNPVAGFTEANRQRRVKAWNPTAGTLEVDRQYTVVPVAGEVFEVCHLNPEQIIRKALLAGLRRARFENRLQVNLSGVATERNLTAVLPWLLEKRWIKGVFYKEAASTYDPVPVRWSKAFMRDGGVWLAVAPDPYPNALYLVVNQPAFTWVNGGYSAEGPEADDDLLPLTLEHAAAAGHIECWRLAKALLRPLAERELTATQQEAADEFTRQNRRFVTRAQPVVNLSRPMYAVRA